MRTLGWLIAPVFVTLIVCGQATPAAAQEQIKAVARSAPAPPWSKGILRISAESYWNAVECGKQGGADPPCVFWDTGLCKNNDFALAFYTPYKMVAYAVWNAVRQMQAPPTPSYQEAERTRITIGVTPVRGTKNALTDLTVRRGTTVVPPVSRSLSDGDSRFTYDYPAFAATGAVTIDMVGKTGTIACAISQTVLTQFR